MNKPVAWMLKTGHGTKILEVKPYCEVDLWTPLYTHPANACKHGVDDGACKECYLESSNPYKAITNTKIEPTAVSYTHPVKENCCPDCGCHFTGEYPFNYTVKELTDEEIIESLAELEHEQWMKWADTIMQTEKISDSRFARWASCMIPYAELSEEMKEHDRVWARQALAILRKAQEK